MENQQEAPINKGQNFSQNVSSRIENACHQLNSLSGCWKTIFKEGRWTSEESKCFEQNYLSYKKNWTMLAQLIPTRTPEQIRSHAQKYVQKIQRKLEQQKRRNQANQRIQKGQKGIRTRGKKLNYPKQLMGSNAPHLLLHKDKKISKKLTKREYILSKVAKQSIVELPMANVPGRGNISINEDKLNICYNNQFNNLSSQINENQKQLSNRECGSSLNFSSVQKVQSMNFVDSSLQYQSIHDSINFDHKDQQAESKTVAQSQGSHQKSNHKVTFKKIRSKEQKLGFVFTKTNKRINELQKRRCYLYTNNQLQVTRSSSCGYQDTRMQRNMHQNIIIIYNPEDDMQLEISMN